MLHVLKQLKIVALLAHHRHSTTNRRPYSIQREELEHEHSEGKHIILMIIMSSVIRFGGIFFYDFSSNPAETPCQAVRRLQLLFLFLSFQENAQALRQPRRHANNKAPLVYIYACRCGIHLPGSKLPSRPHEKEHNGVQRNEVWWERRLVVMP